MQNCITAIRKGSKYANMSSSSHSKKLKTGESYSSRVRRAKKYTDWNYCYFFQQTRLLC